MKRAWARAPKPLWALLGAACLLTAGYFGFHALFVKVSRSVEQPFSGPARYNDYYVLQRYLQERGFEVRAVRAWPQPLSPDSAVMWLSHDEVPHALREWLAGGGQLWSLHDPESGPFSHWKPTPWDGSAVTPEPADAGADDLEAEDADAGAESAEPEDAGAGVESAEPEDADAGAESAEPEDEDWCENGCLEAAQFRYGAGCLTLVGSYPLRNDQVHLGETPARLDALLECPKRPSSILMVTSVGSPWFGQLLVEHAPEALSAFCVLLALSLWRAGTHLGPKEPPRARERRQLLEHITAVGTLGSRVGLAPLLVAARRELRQQLLRRVPHAGSLSGDALISAVAELTELTPEEVRRALLEEPSGDGAREAVAIARAIQTLWSKT
jgi:hypothetical protein